MQLRWPGMTEVPSSREPIREATLPSGVPPWPWRGICGLVPQRMRRPEGVPVRESQDLIQERR